MASVQLDLEQVLNALEDEDTDVGAGGISSDEEELDRSLGVFDDRRSDEEPSAEDDDPEEDDDRNGWQHEESREDVPESDRSPIRRQRDDEADTCSDSAGSGRARSGSRRVARAGGARGGSAGDAGASSVRARGSRARGGRARGSRTRSSGARGGGARSGGARGGQTCGGGTCGGRARSGRARGGRARGGRARGGRADGAGAGGAGDYDNERVVPKGYDDPDTRNTLPPFTPNRPPGVHFEGHVLRGALTTELEFFYLFFTKEMIKSIVTHTNSYAYVKLLAGGHTSYATLEGGWKETTEEEINRLIALLIYFGLVNVTSVVEKYWSTKTLYHGLWARKILSRTRYKALMAFLHVVDPADEVPGNKLRKVEQFIMLFKERCHFLYQPCQNVSVDERMVKSKHRYGIRQYMKNKPTKWGIKLWVLADSSNGYTVDFNVYIGKTAHGGPSENGLGYDVVMKLVEPYLKQGYHVYMDNFFTSDKLLSDLFLQGTPASGTTRTNRDGFPLCLKDMNAWARREKRGGMRWVRVSKVLYLQWVDNKCVSFVTTIDSANDKITVQRRTKKNGVFKMVDVSQPTALHRYNQYMNGVDRSDQMLACHNISRKCYRWWKALFFHLIDIAVVNSYILFEMHRANNPDNPALHRHNTYNIVDFREAIVRQICGLAEYDQPPAYEAVQPAGQFDTVHVPQSGVERRHCVVCYAAGRGQKKVHTYCSAPQCKNKFMHVGGELNCFGVWHCGNYAGRR